MAKISSSHMDPHQTDADKTALEIFLSKKSLHFTPGTFILSGGKRYEIIRVTTCRCAEAEKTLRCRDEDGRMVSIKPLALNNHVRPTRSP